MEAPANAPLVGIDIEYLEQLFSSPASFSWSGSGRGAMSLWLGSGEVFVSSAGGSVGFPLVLNVPKRRRVFAISEDGDGRENIFLEELDMKPYTAIHVLTSSYFVKEGETPVRLPTSMFLGFGQVQPYQTRPNNPPKQVFHEQAAKRGAQPPAPRPRLWARKGQATYPRSIAERVLSMRRLSGAAVVAQFGADIPLQLIEAISSKWAKQHVWEKKCSTESRPIPLATITYSHVQSSESSILKPPEPNAPL